MLPTTRTRCLLLLAGAALVCTEPSVARATELEDFERARAAYTDHDYPRSVELFEQMVGGPVPAIRNPLLIEQSRTYLAAAYIFVENRSAAEEQFERLLRTDPAYRVPTSFPAPVVSAFETVLARVRQQTAIDARDAAQREAAARARRREVAMRLVELAQENEVEVRHDPLIAWLPFGAGQFQNGNGELGAFFAVTESILLAAAAGLLASWTVLYEQYVASLEFRAPPPDRGALVGLQVSHFVTLGAFALTAFAGIIEAHVNFVPSHRERRQREVPDEMLEGLDIAIGPASLHFRLRF